MHDLPDLVEYRLPAAALAGVGLPWEGVKAVLWRAQRYHDLLGGRAVFPLTVTSLPDSPASGHDLVVRVVHRVCVPGVGALRFTLKGIDADLPRILRAAARSAPR